MNRKVSIAVGAAAALAFTGAALANDTVTINSSEGYVATSVAAPFVPGFLTADCGSSVFLTTSNCEEHGAQNVINAAAYITGSSLATNYWTGGDSVPGLNLLDSAGDLAPEASGYRMFEAFNGDKTGDAFNNGLFNVANTASYFSGIELGWNTIGDALGLGPDLPMGAPASIGGEATERDNWIDQTVVGYVESLNSGVAATNGTTATDTVALAQNFRTQISFLNTTAEIRDNKAVIDQRLEQMVELTNGSNFPAVFTAGGDFVSGASTGEPGNPNQFEASRQTLQQAFGMIAGGANDGSAKSNTTTDPDVNNATDLPVNPNAGPGDAANVGQLVAQDIEGFFFSCLNCDSAQAGYSHDFSPMNIDARYQAYTSTWNVVPTVIHTGQ